MWKSVVHWLLGPIASAWMYSRIRHDGEMVLPTDAPLSHGSGPDPDRVLLIGGTVVGGAGVVLYDLALGGRLARRLAARTGRGADVETRSASRYDTEAIASILRAENLQRFDAVVILLGVRAILRMRPVALWRRDLQVLMDVLRESVPPALPVLLVGVSKLGRDMDLPRFVVRWLDDTVDRHNVETQRMCEQTGIARYVAFDPERSGVRPGVDASLVYESWANALVPALDIALAEHQPVQRPADTDERRRRDAVSRPGVLDEPVDPRLTQIVQMTRGMLGMPATLSIVEGDTLHLVAAAGVRETGPVPRSVSFTHVNVRTPGVMIVPDALRDARFAMMPEVTADTDRVRFYAGYPLEAPGGQRIGALCVIDSQPREFSAGEVSLLRDLALRAQSVLWERAEPST